MNLTVSVSPHIRGRGTPGKMMLDVIIALLPALGVGIYRFGPRAAIVTLVSVLCAVLAEAVLRLVTRKSVTILDGSAVVTGLLLAMTLPASVPYWLAGVGAVFAVVIVKGLCGGLGQNVLNPALAARAFLMLAFAGWMTRYGAPGASLPLGSIHMADVTTSATPLHQMQMPALPDASLWDMLLGNSGGTIGETCALALLLGGLYLIFRRVISYRVPVAYLGTIAVITVLFPKGNDPLMWMAYSLMSGGAVLGAFFMATDYATSPVSHRAQWVYGVGCGALTVVFRYFGLFPEGITYAILLMNAATWALDRWLPPRRFGTKEART